MKTNATATEFTTRRGRTVASCATCGAERNSYSHNQTPEQWVQEHADRVHFTPEVGDFLSHRYVTDTAVWEVVAVSKTGKSMQVRSTLRGETLDTYSDGGPWPVNFSAALSDPTGTVRVVRRRKDGTWRLADYARLTPAATRGGVPVTTTDYRM